MYLVQSGLGRDQRCELTLLEYSGIVWCLVWLCSSLWQLTPAAQLLALLSLSRLHTILTKSQTQTALGNFQGNHISINSHSYFSFHFENS